MVSSESGPSVGQTGIVAPPSTEPVHAPGIRPHSRWKAGLIAVAGGVVAGLVAWMAGEQAANVFHPRLYKTEVMGLVYDLPTQQSQRVADIKNALLTVAILGGATGMAMGLAGGLAGGSPRRGVMVGLAALVAGTLAGVLSGFFVFRHFFRDVVPDVNDLLTPILLHGAIWMVIGAVGGLAFALGIGGRPQRLHAAVAAGIGAFLASVLYHVLGAILSPGSNASDPVAKSADLRFLAMTLFTVLVAAGAAIGALGQVREAPRTSAS
jgi:hypothetical protein